jgi:hypothetical protein
MNSLTEWHLGAPPFPQKSRAQSLVGNRPGAEHVPGEGLILGPCQLSEAPNLRLQGPTLTQPHQGGITMSVNRTVTPPLSHATA